jgi:hypothetical protein
MCAAFEATMDFVSALVRDELQAEATAAVRLILPHGQVGAVMGKGGKTIRCAAWCGAAGLHAACAAQMVRRHPALTGCPLLLRAVCPAPVFRDLRNMTGSQLFITSHPDVPRCVKKGEEVRVRACVCV